jgi:hypothetical protein
VVGFNPIRASLLRASLRALTIAAFVIGSWLSDSRVLAADNSGTGVEGSAAADMPDVPIPSTAQGTYSPIVEGFESPLEPRADLRATQPEKKVQPKAKAPPPEAETDERTWLYGLKERLQDDAPFVRDTELKVNSRSYWLTRQSIDGSHAEALTSGGYVSYQSGYAGDVVQLRGVLYTTQPLYAPAGGGGTLNLTPDQDQISTLGQANARFKLAGQELSVGRQLIRTAFINPQDTRMIPLPSALSSRDQ